MSVVVEAGHYYAINGPSEASVQSWKIGQELVGDRPDGTLVLFVDDYHGKQPRLGEGDAFLQLEMAAGHAASMRTRADCVFSEAKLAQGAPYVLSDLLGAGLVEERDGRLLAGVVDVSTRIGRNGTPVPACAFLDYMLLLKKVKLGGDQVTVLPSGYEREQGQLARLVKQLGVQGLESYAALFFDPNNVDRTKEVRYI